MVNDDTPSSYLPDCTPGFQNAVFERTKNSGAEVLKKKGGAGYAVGIAIRDVIHAVLLDKKTLLPVSSLVQGAYGIRDICISVPSVISRKGIEKHLELNPDDARALYLGAGALVLLGERDRGLEWTKRARAIDPEDPGVLYNVACSYALLGRSDDAIACLEQAIWNGFGHREWLDNDSDLDSLRADPRFQALRSKL